MRKMLVLSTFACLGLAYGMEYGSPCGASSRKSLSNSKDYPALEILVGIASELFPGQGSCAVQSSQKKVRPVTPAITIKGAEKSAFNAKNDISDEERSPMPSPGSISLSSSPSSPSNIDGSFGSFKGIQYWTPFPTSPNV